MILMCPVSSEDFERCRPVLETMEGWEKTEGITAWDDLPEAAQAIRTEEEALGEVGRVLVRYSGTEPLLRIMVEGEGEDGIRASAERLATAFKRLLGTPGGER